MGTAWGQEMLLSLTAWFPWMQTCWVGFVFFLCVPLLPSKANDVLFTSPLVGPPADHRHISRPSLDPINKTTQLSPKSWEFTNGVFFKPLNFGAVMPQKQMNTEIYCHKNLKHVISDLELGREWTWKKAAMKPLTKAWKMATYSMVKQLLKTDSCSNIGDAN